VNVAVSGSGCAWTATSNTPSMVTITGGGAGTGNGAVNYSVTGNQSSAVSRSGTITVSTSSGQATFTVTQAGTNCSYSLSQASQTFASTGGSGTATVAAPGGCNWTANNAGAPWVAISSGASGSGNGTVSYTVPANNSSTPLRGTLTIAGQPYTVSQAGTGVSASCTANVATPSQAALEGRTEVLGDLVLDCTGLSSAVSANIALTLNTNVTNTLSGTDTLDAQLVNGSVTQNGHITGYNVIRWTGVTLGPGETMVRITNVRADASLLGSAGNLRTAAVTGQVSVYSGPAVPVSHVAQAAGCGAPVAAAEIMACAGPTLLFQKGQATPPTGGPQTVIPLVYQDAAPGEFTAATRLRLVLSKVPGTVQVYAPVYPNEGTALAQLYSADANGSGGAPVTGSPLAGGTYQQLTVSGGSATATWVVLSANASAIEKFTFPLLVTNATNSDLNTIQIGATLGPVSDVGVASASAPAPRYRDFSVPQKLVNLRISIVTAAGPASAAAVSMDRSPAPMPRAAVKPTVVSTIQIVNDTSDPTQGASNVTVKGDVAGAVIVGCTATGSGTCAGSGGEALANYGNLAAGESQTVTLTEQYDPTTSGTVDTSVNAGADQVDADLSAAAAASSFIFLNGVPVVVGSQPPSGNGNTQSFTFQFSHPSGYQNLGVVNVLINSSLDGRHACYLAYSIPYSTLYLVDDAGDAGGPYAGSVALGSTSVIQNSQCAVALTSAAGSGTTLTLTLNITFSASFGGNKIAYVAARDQVGSNSNWQALGVWQVPWTPTGTITVGSANPAHGSGATISPQAISFTVTDSKGFADIGIVNVLINDFIDGRRACYLAYVTATNTLYLVDDAGDAGGPFAGALVLNGAGQIANGQCQVNGSGTLAQSGGNSLTLTLNVNFFGSFGGNRVMYVAGRDAAGGNNTDWQAAGTWTVP